MIIRYPYPVSASGIRRLKDSALRRLKDFVDRQTLLSVHNAIIRPYFDYCCEIWDVFSETQSKRLQKLQNRAARIIMNMSNDTDHSVALKALGWKTLDQSRKEESQGKNDV